MSLSIEEMLERRHELKLAWHEPWPATAPQGDAIDAHVECRATVHDCVNLYRSTRKQLGKPAMGNDAEFLESFIAVHWAQPVIEST